jgi:hypothetical protein
MGNNWRAVVAGAAVLYLAAACEEVDSSADAQAMTQGQRHPYFLQENPDMTEPSTYWLLPATDGQPHRLLWCISEDDWDQILEVDGVYLAGLPLEKVVASLFPSDGRPVQATVRTRSGDVRTLECFASAAGKPAGGP